MKLELYLSEWNLFENGPYGVKVEVPDKLWWEYCHLRERLTVLLHDIGCEYWPAREAQKPGKVQVR